MKKALLLATLLTGAIIMTGCSEAKKITETDLMHHRFVLVKANGEDVAAEKQVELEFSEHMNVTGKMCNRFFGKVSLDGDIIKGSGIAMTRMLCNDEQLDKLDNIIGQLFTNGANVTLTKDQLVLKDKDNELVYQLKDLM